MFGEKIMMLRKEHNMSQAALAERIGVTQQNIYCYEHNRTQPKFETLCMMADLFDCSIDYLLGRTEVRIYNKNATPEEVAHDIEIASDALNNVTDVGSGSCVQISEQGIRELVRDEIRKALAEQSSDSHQ